MIGHCSAALSFPEFLVRLKVESCCFAKAKTGIENHPASHRCRQRFDTQAKILVHSGNCEWPVCSTVDLGQVGAPNMAQKRRQLQSPQ